MDAIYGELFELGPKGKIINDLATGCKFSDDAKTITLTLRHPAEAGRAEVQRGEPALHVPLRPPAEYQVRAVQRQAGAAGHRRGDQLRAHPPARLQQPVPGHWPSRPNGSGSAP
ncbi:MAG TPA: hypothetical protein VFQ68_43375 [Streptosporangiaceae bacterium]|nr:hypothetical protein [Streptosporangiaceae bacterium]